MISVKPKCESHVQQGEVFRDIHMIGDVTEDNGILEVGRISFPYVIVLTQECDLEEDFRLRSTDSEEAKLDKLLLSVLIAPLYNADHLRKGEHLSELKINGQKINGERVNSKHWNHFTNNMMPRYHYLEFPNSAKLVPLVIDFKHYFSVNLEYLKRVREEHYITTVAELFRERISQRFANYLSRIGLPDANMKKPLSNT
jgi:hypothetical protein